MTEKKPATTAIGTKDLDRVLGKWDLMAIAIGATIGSGIFSLTGVAIGMTGRSVNLAFIVSAILVILVALPNIYIGGTVRLLGGQYTQAALLIDQRFGGFFAVTTFMSNFGLSTYGISFAQYVISLVPELAPYSKLLAFACLTIFYLVNLMGISSAAKAQNLMVLLMSGALALFIAFGIGDIQPGYFEQPGWMTGGAWGFMVSVAYLQSATAGAFAVVNYSAEAKNPTKDIPFVIIVATLIVGILYALTGTVAAGVLPVEVVANQPLTEVAKSVLPAGLMYFFIIAGAGFALSTTLNATLGWVTKPALQATLDGWYPRWMGAVSKKRKVPYIWLTLIYALSAASILTGWDIGTITGLTMVIVNVNNIILAIAAMRLPKVLPEQWEKSAVHRSDAALKTGCIASALAASIQLFLCWSWLDTPLKIGNFVFIIFAALYIVWRNKYVHMEVSYEDV